MAGNNNPFSNSIFGGNPFCRNTDNSNDSNSVHATTSDRQDATFSGEPLPSTTPQQYYKQQQQPSPTMMTTTRRTTRNSSRGFQQNNTRSSSSCDDVMMGDNEDDVATTQGVKADALGFAVRNPCEIDAEGSVTGNSLILPRPLLEDNSSGEVGMEDDDDISTLTEYSMEDDDEVSQTTQNTAWTVITTGTDSTTIPTQNFSPNGDKRERLGEKRHSRKENRLLNNTQFKRRRMG